MAGDNLIQLLGVVTESKGNGFFRVFCKEENSTINCTLSGKIRQNNIRIIEGDKVKIEVSAYDLTKGRIIFREK